MAFRQALGEAFARGAGPLLPLAFFTGAAVLVPFGIGTDAERLQGIAPGLAFALMALSSLVTLERLFQSDLEDGALDLWVQSEAPLAIIASAKTLAHWLAAGLPLALATPLLQLMFQAEANAALLMHAALAALGSLAFYFWGGVGAALAAGVRRGGLLISLLVLPLYIPTAIFGALALGGQTESHTALLGLAAATLFALGLAPFAMAAALRLAAD
jgi:heme exporter protein B